MWPDRVSNPEKQLKRDVKTYVRFLNFIFDVTYAASRKTPNDVRRRLSCLNLL